MSKFLITAIKVPVLLAGGMAITLLLFYCMQALINEDYSVYNPTPGIKITAITENFPELVIENKTEKPEKLIDPPELPPNERVLTDSPTPTDGIFIPQEVIQLPLDTDFSVFADSNALPLVRVNPTYPTRALDRGIEGFVVAEFDVSEIGQVINPRILYSEPAGVFDSAALKALTKWRYEPKVSNGQAVVMKGLQARLTFTIGE